MSYYKKPQYQNEFIDLIQRKVLYNDPIFLLKVEFKATDSSAKPVNNSVGGSSTGVSTKKYTTVIDKLTYSKELFRNISKFAESSLQSQSLISIILRNILLNKSTKLDKPLLSISDTLINSCNLIANAHIDHPIETKIAFPADIVDIFDGKKKSILLIDFDVQSEEQSNIAASLKKLYFGHSKVTSHGKQHIIEYAKTRGYKLVAMTQFTFASDLVKPYGFVFQLL